MWALGWFWLGPAEGCEPPAEAAAVVTEHVVVASSPLLAEVEENFCHLHAAPGLWVLGFGVYFKIHNLTLNLKPKSKPGSCRPQKNAALLGSPVTYCNKGTFFWGYLLYKGTLKQKKGKGYHWATKLDTLNP